MTQPQDETYQPKMFPGVAFGSRTYWSPEMLQKLFEVAEKNKGPDLTSDKLATMAEVAIMEIPEPQRNVLPHKVIRKKIGDLPYLIGGARAFLREGPATIDFAKLHPDVLSKDGSRIWEAESKARTSKPKRKFTSADMEISGQFQSQQTSQRTNLAPVNETSVRTKKLKNTMKEYSMQLIMRPAPPEDVIRAGMQDLFDQVDRTVNNRLVEGGLSGDERIMKFPRINSPAWQGVLETITGGAGLDLEPHLVIIEGMMKMAPLTREILMRAVIAAAVSRWALMPVPMPVPQQGEEPHTTFLFRVHEELKKMDGLGAAVVMESATRKYLKEDATPLIPRKAELMGDDVEELLVPLMLPAYGESSSKIRQLSTAATFDGTRLPTMRLPQWEVDWKQELRGIFESALKLRILMEREAPGGQYTFDFPKPGASFPTTEESTSSPLTPEPPIEYTMIGLLPSIEGRFQNELGGPHSEPRLLSKAVVFSFRPSLPPMAMANAVSHKEVTLSLSTGGLNPAANTAPSTQLFSHVAISSAPIQVDDSEQDEGEDQSKDQGEDQGEEEDEVSAGNDDDDVGRGDNEINRG